MAEKEKQRKRVFLVNDREYFALSHFIFTDQNEIFLSLSSTVKVVNVANYQFNYIKRDLGNPNFSYNYRSATIVIPFFSWTISGVHIFKLRL